MLRHMNPIYSLPLYLFKSNFYMVAEELILRRGETSGESYDTHTFRHNSIQNYKYAVLNDNQCLHYHLYQAVHCRRNNSSSPLQNSPWSARACCLSRLHDHTQTHHTGWHFSGRVVSPTQITLRDNTQHSQETDLHAPGGIRTYNPSKQAATDPRFT